MTRFEFDNTAFGGNMYAVYEGERKFIVSVNFPERLFGLLPERPADDDEFDPWEIQWVRCESVTEVYVPQVIQFNQ
ncbi:hypothetical protein J4N45_10420 [Vibrio sp. SCSIO 43140]|uniref:hypothetical protein n=1 Tax=Vibrio sp. SCSIO 43140 TaxID=2819100 RepID=UPI002075E424|nr:hypothetical protein [Vibrio sp. SCSIO 43140]USD58944.1 hypothetical protein J4N45_10420 [Vibrio sp. SCSIO 43140]